MCIGHTNVISCLWVLRRLTPTGEFVVIFSSPHSTEQRESLWAALWPRRWGICKSAYPLSFDSSFFLTFFFCPFKVLNFSHLFVAQVTVALPSSGVSMGSKKSVAELQRGVPCNTSWICQVSCMYNSLFNSQNICMWHGPLSPFYSWGIWGSKMLSHLCSISWQVSAISLSFTQSTPFLNIQILFNSILILEENAGHFSINILPPWPVRGGKLCSLWGRSYGVQLNSNIKIQGKKGKKPQESGGKESQDTLGRGFPQTAPRLSSWVWP